MPTLISFREISDGREGGNELSSGRVGTMTNRTYTRIFVAEFYYQDGPSGSDAALLTPGFPKVGDVYLGADGAVDLGSYCVSQHATQFGAPWIWKLTAKYTGDIDLSNPSGDPLLMPPNFSWGDKTATTVATAYDSSGNEIPILNTAGDPVDPPPADEESWTTLKITRNKADFDPIKAAGYKNKINSDPWLGFKVGDVLCTGLSAESEWVKGALIWKVVGAFEIKQTDTTIGGKLVGSWDLVILDRGFQAYDAAGNKRANVDSLGRALSGASLLDGTGKVLPKGGTPIFIAWKVKLTAVFANIGLP